MTAEVDIDAILRSLTLEEKASYSKNVGDGQADLRWEEIDLSPRW